MGLGPLDAVIRRLLSRPGVAAVAGLLIVGFGMPWLMFGRAPQGLELLLALAVVAFSAAPTRSLRRATGRRGLAAAAESARKQAMFRNEVDQRLEVQGHLRESEARVRAIIE